MAKKVLSECNILLAWISVVNNFLLFPVLTAAWSIQYQTELILPPGKTSHWEEPHADQTLIIMMTLLLFVASLCPF